MLTKVFGVILILASTAVLVINIFLFLNSSSFLPYHNVDRLTLAESGIFYPCFIGAIGLVMGILLARDKELDSNH